MASISAATSSPAGLAGRRTTSPSSSPGTTIGTGLTAAAGKAAATALRVRTTVSWGGGATYQHWWNPVLRSNVGFGILHHDINNLGGPCAFVYSGAANLSCA